MDRRLLTAFLFSAVSLLISAAAVQEFQGKSVLVTAEAIRGKFVSIYASQVR